jgi:hypothetical protein
VVLFLLFSFKSLPLFLFSFSQLSEPIRKSSIQLNRIALQSVGSLVDNTNVNRYYPLSADGVIILSLTRLIVNLTRSDANHIKLEPSLAKNTSTSFVSLEFGAFADMNDNYVSSYPINNAHQVDAYIEDNISPYILSFTMNLNVENPLLILYFSEPMLISSFDLTHLRIQSRWSLHDGVGYQLTGGIVLSDNSEIITIQLLTDDINNMKLISGLIRKKQSTYLVSSASVGTDLAGNPLLPNKDGDALLCDSYIANTFPPRIVYSMLNMNNGKLEMSFNEPIAVKTVNLTSLTLISQVPSSLLQEIFTFQESKNYSSIDSLLTAIPSYSLSSSSSLIITDPSALFAMSLIIQLSFYDLNAIKSLYPLASSKETTNFMYSSSLLKNWNDLNIKEITFYPNSFLEQDTGVYSPILCNEYLKDVIRPTIEEYHLDMNEGKLILSFSKAINPLTMQLNQLILQNKATRRFGSFISLENATVSLLSSSIMELTLPSSSLSFMKYYGIGFSFSSSFLSWNNTFISDFARNEIIPIWDASVVGFSPTIPSNLTVDATSPSLLRWYLNRKTMEVCLYFNEPIVINQLNQLLLVNSYRSESFLYGISGNSTIRYENMNQLAVISLVNYCQNGQLETIVTVVSTIIRCSNDILPFYAYISSTSSLPAPSTLLLTNGVNAVVDKSSKRNSLIPMYPIRKEGNPGRLFHFFYSNDSFFVYLDCSSCPVGTFVEKNCTLSADRVCKPCSKCFSSVYYEKSPCTSYQDTSCASKIISFFLCFSLFPFCIFFIFFILFSLYNL